MVHEMQGRLAFPRRDAPGLCRGLFQHVSRRGPDLAHRLEEVANAVRAVGVLVAVALVGQSLHHAHPVEVGLHLVRHDHGQRRLDPLSHLGAVSHDLHLPGSVHGHEEIEAKGGSVGRGRTRISGTQAQYERSRPQTGQLQELPPAHHGDSGAHSDAAFLTASRIRR